jgi:7-cyano-7-deazaguanine synthase in queuosine biosynthesis
MTTNQRPIDIDVIETHNGALLKSRVGHIHVATSHPEKRDREAMTDFAAWYFLPVGMRLNSALHIKGRGATETVANFRRLSEIWQSWLPGHFYATHVSFAEQNSRQTEVSHPNPNRDLLYFSGGLDAAYTALVRVKDGHQQDLLTVHGMDYGLSDKVGFEALLNKTRAFAEELSDTRIVVKSDAYALYDKLKVNLKRHHLSHVFALAGAGFFHSGVYQNLVLAADERLDGQFLHFPWGSNSATNYLFDDGRTKLLTAADDLTRSAKLELILNSKTALNSLAFCWNRKIQPENCGGCPKCFRTKMSFLAATGSVPDIFQDPSIPSDWARRLRYREPAGFHAVQEIFNTALALGHAHAIPNFAKAYEEVFGFHRRLREIQESRFVTPNCRWIRSAIIKLASIGKGL